MNDYPCQKNTPQDLDQMKGNLYHLEEGGVVNGPIQQPVDSEEEQNIMHTGPALKII